MYRLKNVGREGEKKMAFINDYLTEEEKARFEGYNIMYPRESVHAGLKLGVGKGKRKCTLDRERNIYLFHTQNTRDRFDYEEYIDYFTLVVLKNGVINVAYINVEQKSGILKEDKDYDYLWICKGTFKLVLLYNSNE